MSRRTKLIILALFLVLLAIPTAYLALTWSPDNPLRFRLVSQKISVDDPFKHLSMQVEVQNTESVAIYLNEVEFSARWKPGASGDTVLPVFAQRLLLHESGSPAHWPYIIAPNSSHQFTTGVDGYDEKTVDMDSAEIRYEFRSDSKHCATELYDRIFRHIPESIGQHIPRPSLDNAAAAPLEQPSK